MSDKKPVILHGLFSDYARNRRHERINICDAIHSLTVDEAKNCREIIENLLKTDFKNTPEAHLLWAQKLFKAGDRENGLYYIQNALITARFDKKPAMIYLDAIKTMNQNGLNQYADIAMRVARKKLSDDVILTSRHILTTSETNAEKIKLLEEERLNHPNDAVIIDMLAKAYVQDDNVSRAITLLKQERPNHPDNTFIIKTLAHAYIQDGKPYSTIALLEQERPNHPGDAVMATILANAYIQTENPQDAVMLLEQGRKSHPGDALIIKMLAHAYIQDGKPYSTIALLEQERPNHPDDVAMITMLSKAYIQTENPQDAVMLLEQGRKSHPDNNVITNMLAGAYVTMNNRQKFDKVVDEINVPVLKDYLRAKLHYFENSGQKAMRILEPYVQKIDTCPVNILGLYMACIPDEHGLHAILPTIHGNETYDYLIKCRDKWRSNPQRLEMKSYKYSDTQQLYELGANAASSSDREKAGMGLITPVHVRGFNGPH